jgi:hypothetical protein
MKKMSREKLRILLMEEYINSYLEEDAVFSKHDMPGDVNGSHGECEPCARKRLAKNSQDHEHSGCGCGSDSKKHKKSYMAKPQLAKIARYAQSLHDTIEDNQELEDWQESKIAQMAQMIGDVYHALEYDNDHDHHEEDLSDIIGIINSSL